MVSQVIVPFDSSGSRLVRTPKVTANLRLAYEGDLAGGRLNGSISSSYASAKYWQPGNFSREGDFVIVNTSLGWTEPSGRFTFSVWSNNPTNTEYFTDYVPNVRGDSVKYAPKREVGVGVNYTF